MSIWSLDEVGKVPLIPLSVNITLKYIFCPSGVGEKLKNLVITGRNVEKSRRIRAEAQDMAPKKFCTKRYLSPSM
jgi:hypothetical protein